VFISGGGCVNDFHDFPQRNLVGGLDQTIPTGSPSHAVHETGPLELKQYLDQKPRRHFVVLGDAPNSHRFVRAIMGG